MKPEEIKKLAIECGAVVGVRSFLTDGDEGILFLSDELAAYTAAVEAPLQARIAQLEAVMRLFIKAGVCNSTDYETQMVAMMTAKNIMELK